MKSPIVSSRHDLSSNQRQYYSPVVLDDEVLPAKSADGEEIPELLNCVDEA